MNALMEEEGIPAELRSAPSGFPVLIERADGWYCACMGCGRMSAAGPGTKEQAEAVLRKVRAAYDQFNRENMN